MSKSTITLTPVPAGAVLLSEGDQDDLVFMVEGGRIGLERDGRPLGEVGAGGLLGVAGVVLGAPQLFTVTGIDRASFAKKMIVTDVEVLRLHYAETLREWRHRFLASRARLAEHHDDRFWRMWEFYLAVCEAAFRHTVLVVFQFQLAKRKATVPLTRDYIAEMESRS